MTKQEFISHAMNFGKLTGRERQVIALLDKGISQWNWDLINHVYTWHPSISEVNGKAQVAMLYVEFGMQVFRDMDSTATEAQLLENDILAAKHKLEELEKERSKWQ